MVILVGAALATLGTYFVSDFKRTRAAAEAAQLRQMLTAGAAAAGGELPGGQFPRRSRPIALPQPLAAQGATLTVELVPEGEAAVAIIRAQLGRRRAEQTLRFARVGEKWQLAAAELSPPDSPSVQRPDHPSAGPPNPPPDAPPSRGADQPSAPPPAQPPASTQPSERSTAASQRS